MLHKHVLILHFPLLMNKSIFKIFMAHLHFLFSEKAPHIWLMLILLNFILFFIDFLKYVLNANLMLCDYMAAVTFSQLIVCLFHFLDFLC